MPKHKDFLYKAGLSILFGLLAFGLNFLDISLLDSAQLKITLLVGLFFPLLLTLAWGWRWGLLCALAGGCQTMWWLWQSDGWGILYAVPVFTLWIVWHGIWADFRRNRFAPSWLVSPFIVEIPFRIVIELGFWTIFPWLVSQNPPPWNPNADLNAVAVNWLQAITLKHTIVAYLFLLFGNILLNMGFIRRFLLLPRQQEQTTSSRVFLLYLSVGLGVWVLDALMDHLFFYEDSFWDLLILNPPAHELFIRLFMLGCFLVFGFIMAEHSRVRRIAQERERHLNRILAAIRNVNQLITHERNRTRLLDGACKMLVETQGFHNAWIVLQEKGKPVEPFFHSGFDHHFSPLADELNRGQLPHCAAMALETSGVHVVHEPSEECPKCPMTGYYQGRAAFTTRLEYEGQLFGWLSVSIPAHYADTEEEQSLFAEVAGDIAYALYNLENTERRERLEKQFATVIQSTPDGVLSLDDKGHVALMNPGAEKMLALHPGEGLGLPFDQFLPEESHPEWKKILERLQKNNSEVWETECRCADRREIPVEIGLSRPDGKTGDESAGLNLIIRDISEQKKREETRLQHHKAILHLATHASFLNGDIQGACEELTRIAVDTLKVPRASVWFVENEGVQIRCQDMYLQSEDRHQSGMVLKEKDFPAYFRALRKGRVIDAHDALTDPRTREFSEPYLHPLHITAMLDGTIRFNGNLAGVICMEQTYTPRVWQPDEIAFVGQMGDQVSLALYNAERHKAQEALRVREAHFRSYVESAPSGIFVCNGEGKYIEVNEAATRITGYSQEELLTMGVPDILPPEEQEKGWNHFVRLQEEGHSSEEFAFIRKDGEQRFWTVDAVKLSEGRFLGFVQDITEQKRLEEANERRIVALTRPLGETLDISLEELFNLGDIQKLQDQFSRATGVASVITDTQGKPLTEPSNFTCFCMEVVRGTEQGLKNCFKSDATLGRPSKDGPIVQTCLSGGLWDAGASISVGGKHIASWLIGQVRDETQTEEGIRDYAREIGADEEKAVAAFRQVPRMSREQFDHCAQALYTLANQLSNIAYQNVQQSRFIAESRQAAEEKAKLEEQYRQAQKMEAVGQLTGGVAHDFNNLLQVINGATEMALDDMAGNHPSRESMQEVAKAGKRAARLVSQLLLFSRRQIMRPENLDLNETVTDLLKMLGRVIGEHVQFIWEPGDMQGVIHADRGMIEQALINLCVNARDAMPEGGTLTISTEAVYIDENYCATRSWAVPGAYGVLKVSDTGCGMDAETQKRIFEPFFTTKDRSKGTGLGLSTVYGIIKQHDGMINVYSELGQGTVFKLYWPLPTKASKQAQESGQCSPVLGGHETILLAEDDYLVRKLGKNLLEKAGYTVQVARNGREALEIFMEDPDKVDLAILDVVMPEMGGREAHDRMKSVRPDIKVLFASGYSENAIHTNYILDKPFTLIQKPFTRRVLLEHVRKILDGQNPV